MNIIIKSNIYLNAFKNTRLCTFLLKYAYINIKLNFKDNYSHLTDINKYKACTDI